jgi:hypothetical protein
MIRIGVVGVSSTECLFFLVGVPLISSHFITIPVYQKIAGGSEGNY